MPDVIITGMEIPESCKDCQISQTGLFYRWCGIDIPGISNDVEGHMDSRPDWCPLRPAPEWISVEERLPDQAGYKCLVAAKYGDNKRCVFTAFTGYGDFKWYTYEAPYMAKVSNSSDNAVHQNYTITHWMPLPEPPEGGDGDV